MDGEKDTTTLQYEREIRIGMVLLGVLAMVFVGVLAQRIWIDNRQVIAASKKPIYLTKAQRDELRAKTKPRSLASLHASTPMKRLRTSPSAVEREPSGAESDLTSIPDLVIGGSETDDSESRPANYVEPTRTKEDDPPTKPGPLEREAKPPEKVDLNQSGDRETPMEDDEAQATPDDANAVDGLPDEASREPDINQFKVDAPKEKTEAAPAHDSPAPIEASPLNAPESTASSKTNDAASTTPPREGGEVVRKKVEKNPWKRPAAPPREREQVQYTVQSGDTLKSIAKEILGDESRWQEIYDLNRAEVGDDTSYLRKGMRLKLPKSTDAPAEEPDPRSKEAKIEMPSVLKK